MKENKTIKNRAYSMELSGEYSFLKYNITASGYIIDEMRDALEKIEKKYPKMWEK